VIDRTQSHVVRGSRVGHVPSGCSEGSRAFRDFGNLRDLGG